MGELPFTFTIEDFIGAVMPGMVWSVEFFTFNELLKPTSCIAPGGIPSTFQVAMSYAEGKSVAFYIGFAVSSLILGYISNVFPTRMSEKVSFYTCKHIPVIKKSID